MPSSARRNIHGKQGVRFKSGYTASKNKNMLRNVVTDLIVYEKVNVTANTAMQLKKLADRLITYAKKGDLAARRQAARIVRDVYANEKLEQTALQKLFDVLAPRYQNRQGGYTRVLKIGNRRGDNAPIVMVQYLE